MVKKYSVIMSQNAIHTPQELLRIVSSGSITARSTPADEQPIPAPKSMRTLHVVQSNTFEWCNAGIQSKKENLHNLSYETDIAGWPEVYGETGILYCADVKEPAPYVLQIVVPQSIKSMLHCTIMDRSVFRGYVGFDECIVNCLWTQGQVDMLKIPAEMLAVFLLKQRATVKK